MTPELKKLLFAKLLYGEEHCEKRINSVDRRKTFTYLANDRRIGFPDRRMNVSTLINKIREKFK